MRAVGVSSTCNHSSIMTGATYTCLPGLARTASKPLADEDVAGLAVQDIRTSRVYGLGGVCGIIHRFKEPLKSV